MNIKLPISLNKGARIRHSSRRGQTLVEYSLILAIISVVAISVLISMSGQVTAVYTTIDRQLVVAGSGGAAGQARAH